MLTLNLLLSNTYKIKILMLGLHNTAFVDKMEKAEVVPDVISRAPSELLKICFSGGLKFNSGDKLTPKQTKTPPCAFWSSSMDSFYTMCMVDPDVPSRKQPTLREWQNWLVGNIPGDHVSKGDTLSQYVGPCPPQGTGFHRFVLLIYKQNARIQFSEPLLSNLSGDHRELFSISKFAEKYTLEGPVAGNFFLAKYDNSVDNVFKRLRRKLKRKL